MAPGQACPSGKRGSAAGACDPRCHPALGGARGAASVGLPRPAAAWDARGSVAAHSDTLPRLIPPSAAAAATEGGGLGRARLRRAAPNPPLPPPPAISQRRGRPAPAEGGMSHFHN